MGTLLQCQIKKWLNFLDFLEHESDDRAGNRVYSVYVASGKDMALKRQI